MPGAETSCAGRRRRRARGAGVLRSRGVGIAAALLLLIAAGGCGGSGGSYVHPSVDFSYMKRATILPFRNLTSDDLADERIQSIFLMELLEADILEIVDPRETAAALAELDLHAGEEPTPEQCVALGKKLNVDALFLGTVEEYGISRVDRSAGSEVTIVLEMVETQTGVVVWRSQVHASGATWWSRLFGGGPRDLYSVSRSAVRKALGTLI
jgi:hypothetical protein